MRALGYYLIIKDVEPKTKKNSIGLELTDDQRKDIRYRKAEIISVGEELTDKLLVGDVISYDRHAGNQLEEDDTIYKVISARDVVVIWTEKTS